MKKVCLLVVTLFVLAIHAHGQYRFGIGARFGKLNNGVTLKQFFDESQGWGMEFDLFSSLIAAQYGFTTKGFILNQTMFRVPIIELPLDFIAGGGLQVGYFPYDAPGYYKIVDGRPDYYGESVVTVGVAAMIGIEYQFKTRKLPISIGLDAVPSYDFVHPGPDWFDFGVNVRYMIR